MPLDDGRATDRRCDAIDFDHGDFYVRRALSGKQFKRQVAQAAQTQVAAWHRLKHKSLRQLQTQVAQAAHMYTQPKLRRCLKHKSLRQLKLLSLLAVVQRQTQSRFQACFA